MIEFTCHYCKGLFHWTEVNDDHIVPKSRGGRNAKWNIAQSCIPCNTKKAANMPTCKCDRCREAVRLHHFQDAVEGKFYSHKNNPLNREMGKDSKLSMSRAMRSGEKELFRAVVIAKTPSGDKVTMSYGPFFSFETAKKASIREASQFDSATHHVQHSKLKWTDL